MRHFRQDSSRTTVSRVFIQLFISVQNSLLSIIICSPESHGQKFLFCCRKFFVCHRQQKGLFCWQFPHHCLPSGIVRLSSSAERAIPSRLSDFLKLFVTSNRCFVVKRLAERCVFLSFASSHKFLFRIPSSSLV